MSTDDKQAFASSFSQLASSILSQKVPQMMNYLLGFQVIESSDDNSRGVGFFAFNIADQMVYTPCFFLRGEIKGIDLLYLKQRDVFVPLNEEWIGFIESKKTLPMGEAEPKDSSEIGVTNPDLSRSSAFSFNTKISAADLPVWAQGGLDMFTKLRHVNQDPRYKNAGFINGLQKISKAKGLAWLSAVKKNEKVASFFINNYDLGEVEKALSRPKTKKVAAAKVAAEVEVIDSIRSDLSDLQKEAILRGDYIVVDNRERAKLADVARSKITMYDSPNTAGKYDILYRDGEFKESYVLNLFTIGSGRQHGFMLVYRKDGKKVHKARPRDIVTDKIEVSFRKEENEDAFMGLGESPKNVSKNDVVMFVDCFGNATTPVRVTAVSSDIDGNKYVTVDEWNDFYVEKVKNEMPGDAVEERYTDKRPFDNWSNGCSPIGCAGNGNGANSKSVYEVRNDTGVGRSNREIVVTSRDTDGLVNIGNKTVVPANRARMIVIEKYKPYNPDDKCVAMPYGVDLESKPQDELATPLDFEGGLRKSASYDKVKLSYNGSEYVFANKAVVSDPMSTAKIARHLIVDNGFCEADARSLIKEATENGSASYVIKQAINFSPATNYFDPRTGIQATNGQMTSERIPGQEPAPFQKTEDKDFGPQDIGQIEQAAASGQKDIFDAAALGSLININDPSEEINRFIPDLIVSIDKLGRILFLMYWHYDKFEERYEKQELVSLEDELLNLFKNLGDLTMDLHQRAIVDNPSVLGFSLA